GRVRLESDRPDEEPFGLEFQVESYLEGHARRFVRRYDPNSYLYLSRSMDWFDLAEYADGDVRAALAQVQVDKALAIGARTDILLPVEQQQAIAEGLAAGGARARFVGMESPQGHDAFLVDFERFGPAVSGFLDGLLGCEPGVPARECPPCSAISVWPRHPTCSSLTRSPIY